MHIKKSHAALIAASLALTSSPALAEDARITCTGTVSSVLNGGVPSSAFANASVGESVTLTFDAEIARQLPFGDYLHLINSPSSSIAIGGASDGFTYSLLNTFRIRDNFGPFGDVVALEGRLASDASVIFQLSLSDPSGLALDSEDVTDFYGTSFNLDDYQPSFYLLGATGSVQIDLTSVEIDAAPGGPVGTPYCTAAPNSTGSIGTTSAFGLQGPGENDLTLTASGLPTQSFGFFIVSSDQSFVAGAGGSEGNLCLGGAIGRFVGEDQVMQTDFGGEIALPVDLTNVPSPTGSVSVQAGQTLNFQLWVRDTNAAGATSNFTRGLSVTFQ